MATSPSLGRRISRRTSSLRRFLTGSGGEENAIHPSASLRGDIESQIASQVAIPREGAQSPPPDPTTSPGFLSPAATPAPLGAPGPDVGATGRPGASPPPPSGILSPTYQRPLPPPATSKLAIFRAITGINTEHGLTILEGVNRPASNIGIYTQVVANEKQASFEYHFFRLLISTCLGLQLIIAAALTALGAGNGPRSAVTVFGALNTVTAGFLTYLKGSGLPNRKRYYMKKWEEVRHYIEMREREFALPDCKLDVDDEVAIVERMYEDVKAEVEANIPENYVSKASQMPKSDSRLGEGSVVHDHDPDHFRVTSASVSRHDSRRSGVRVPERVAEQPSQTSSVRIDHP